MMGRVANPGQLLWFEGFRRSEGVSRGRRMEAYQCRVSLCRPGLFLLAAWLLMAAGLLCYAQAPATHRDADTTAGAAVAVAMPDAPEVRAAEESAGGVICGTVLDSNGAQVEGATAVLEGASGRDQRDVTAAGTGFFRVNSLAPAP